MDASGTQRANERGRGRGRGRRGGRGRGRASFRRGRGGLPKSGSMRTALPSQNGVNDLHQEPATSSRSVAQMIGLDHVHNVPVDLSQSAIAPDVLRSTQRTTSTTLAELTGDRFEDLPIAPSLKVAISHELKYETMTMVQSKSIPVALLGGDALVKARTGTGKTLAFLTPAFHRSLLQGPISRNRTAVLVISPTRELTQQIADEATVLLSRTVGPRVQVVFGGTPIKKDYSTLRSKGAPFLLVATPGRLLDHLTNPNSGFKAALSTLSVLILDEADHLLDMGFRQEIEKIIRELATRSPRQTLLFSATMPADVRSIAQLVLRNDFRTIDCVGEEKNTHAHVTQSVCITPMENQVAALGIALMQSMTVPSFKIIVFFTTARLTQFFAELFERMGRPVLEIHSRKTQRHRTKISDEFRTGSNVILFTSDVTARGLDYPDVTSVLQVGLPADKTQYVHRIGRTARAGKVGNGTLLLADFEENFLQSIKEIPIQKIGPLPPDTVAAFNSTAAAATAKLPALTKGAAYQSWLGYYNSNLRKIGWSKEKLVERANHWARTVCHEEEPPYLLARTVGKMGLKGIPGLRIQSGDGGRGRGRRGGARGKGSERGGGTSRGRVSRPYRV